MNPEERKLGIRRKLILSQYPRRDDAEFTDANDHNPLVLVNCAKCGGYGKCDTYFADAEGNSVQSVDYCEMCGGGGVLAEVELYYPTDNAAMKIDPTADGWIRCPCCGWRFSIKDKNAWTGRRHRRCGQKLHISDRSE